MAYVPLSRRSSQEIRVQAETYRRMAETARTLYARQALERVAARFLAFAERREAEERAAAGEQLAAAPAEPKSE